MFSNEVRAYARLRSVQDVVVPRLYATGTLDVGSGGVPRAVAPPVLLLQYVEDVVSLEQLDPALVSRTLLDSAVASVQRFAMLGVTHGELTGSDVLCFPAHRPVHAFFVDFGSARSRREEECEEEWAVAVLEAGDVRRVEALFYWQVERGLPW